MEQTSSSQVTLRELGSTPPCGGALGELPRILREVLCIYTSSGSGLQSVTQSASWERLLKISKFFSNDQRLEQASVLAQETFRFFESTAICKFAALVDINPNAAVTELSRHYHHTYLFLDYCASICNISGVGEFRSLVRAALLLPCVVTLKPPPWKSPLKRHIAQVAKRWISHGSCGSARPQVGEDGALRDLAVLSLTSTREVKEIWRNVLLDAVAEKIYAISFETHELHLSDVLRWKAAVLEPLVQRFMGGGGGECSARERRDEVARLLDQLEQHVFTTYGRHLTMHFFSFVVDYPDSRPSLFDLRRCLAGARDSTLRRELVHIAKRSLAEKLHHAGTQTEDILTFLISSVRSLCALLSRNEQGPVVFSIISDSLKYLKARPDAVSAVVRGLTRREEDGSIAPEFFADFSDGEEDSNEEDEDENNAGGVGATLGPAVGHPFHAAIGGLYHSRPNVLKILLSTLSVDAIVNEYKALLAESLLQGSTDVVEKEAEGLERMKLFLGEEALASCAVMIKDVERSRRMQQHVQEHLGPRADSLFPATVTTVSATCWPSFEAKESVSFAPHPLLQRQFEAYQSSFQALRPSMALKWITSHGAVTVAIPRRRRAHGGNVSNELTEYVEHTTSIFVGSVLLYLGECGDGGAVALDALAERMQMSEDALFSKLKPHSPSLVIFLQNNSLVAVQGEQAAELEFGEVEESAPQAPQGISEKQLALVSRTVMAMLKAQGARTAGNVHNALMMFGQFQGSLEQVKAILDFMALEGEIKVTGDKYALKT